MRPYLQGLYQDVHVGFGDAQRKPKHGWDHDEKDDEVEPNLYGPKDPCPELLHPLRYSLRLSSPVMAQTQVCLLSERTKRTALKV